MERLREHSCAIARSPFPSTPVSRSHRTTQLHNKKPHPYPLSRLSFPLQATSNTAGDVVEGAVGTDGSTAPRVLIAGAGITGLVTALGLLKQGFDVLIFERDMTAIRGEGKYRGPIQIQSNALAALDAIDEEMAEEVFDKGVVTGDRINGLCDGLTGEWYVKFDTFTPAAQTGLPVTRVINRVTFQEILCRHVKKWSPRGDDVIRKNCTVVGYEEKGNRIEVILEKGERYEGDVLIGADGIWSKVRTQLFGPAAPTYSQYTCYTGIADFVPADIDTVGYRVFLGNGKYFVSSDVGVGKMQWYGFHEEPEGGTDPVGERKDRVFKIFGDWCDEVVDLIRATPEEDVLRRDIYDKPPIFQWSKGKVVIMGDAAHAMQPNLGQGGCMAIEDAFQLCLEFGKAEDDDFATSIQAAVKKRAIRAAVIHWLASMAAISASTYKTYLGEGLGPLSFITRYRIPHFGRVIGQVILKIFMPYVMTWVLGGNVNTLKRGAYAPQCRLGDRPRAYDLSEFRTFVGDDDKLRRAAIADWLIMPQEKREYLEGVTIEEEGILVGSGADADLKLQTDTIPDRQARLFKEASTDATLGHTYRITGYPSGHTYINGRRLTDGKTKELTPGDILQFGSDDAMPFKIKLRHVSAREKKKSQEQELVMR